MTNWACLKCDGLGMVPGEGPKWVWCDCPTGQSKKRYQNMSPQEQQRAKRPAKKKPRDDEPIPHWVKE
jgi:hypothetical protein